MAAIDSLFKTVFEKGASDLHLSSGSKPKMRHDGIIREIEGQYEIDAATVKKYLQEIAPARNWSEFEEISDTDFAYELAGVARFRCNFFMDAKGPGGVFRVVPSKVPTTAELKLSPAVVELCQLKKGLVLVTGPTGSGKSTTLAALIEHINTTRKDHIITIEDPIEFQYTSKNCHINQREVKRHTESFKKALRAALREDPDVVLVGEMRDLETVEIALETAETGHLVFATLHTNTAPSSIDRVVDQFPAGQQNQIRIMLASALKAVIAQTLCRKAGGGRVAAFEVLIANSAVAANIRDAKTHQIASLMQVGKAIGMCLLNDSLVELVKSKTVEPMEAFWNAVDKKDMFMRLKDAGFNIDISKVPGLV